MRHRQRDLKIKGIFQNDDEGNKKNARYVYAKECDGCFRPELARYKYGASLSFHGEGEGAPSFQQWVLISRLALDLYNLVNLHPATSMAHLGAPQVDSTTLLRQNGFRALNPGAHAVGG